MQNAAKKFKNYAANIECDIINLMFELLDIINAKTGTLRYLMELYLQIKTVAALECEGKKETDDNPKLSVFDKTTSDSGIAELYNRDELFRKSVEDISDLNKSSLSIIEEDKDAYQEKHSLTPVESKSKEIQKDMCKSEDEIICKARRFIDELVEFALMKTEERRKRLIKRLEETVSRKKSDLFEEITTNQNRVAENKSISSKASQAGSLTSNPSVQIINLPKTVNDIPINNSNRLISNTAIKFENTTFRTIIDPKSHRLYHENNVFQREDFHHEGSLSDVCTNVNVRFVPTQLVSSPKLRKDVVQDDEIQKDEKEIEGVQDKKLIPEVFSQLSDFLPHVTQSSSAMSLGGPSPVQTVEKPLKKKFRKQKKSNVTKIKLDPITYRKICNAILNSVNKKGIAKNMAQDNFKRAVGKYSSCDSECRQAVKSCSNFEFDTIVKKMIPSLHTDLQKFFLSRAKVPHPWNENIIVSGKDVFKK